MSKNRFKKYTAISLIMVLLLSMFSITSCSGGESEESSDSSQVTVTSVPANPLTGQTVEEGFDEAALGQRIVAFVVENSPDARPQWGLDDPEYSPDIVLQGEVEGGITRTLWFYADSNKLPEVIGPMRSARPPYIRFSELFDSVFIHWGQSASKGNYVGANTVFKEDSVEHINQMTFDDTIGLYDRDHTRSAAIEHRGILYGSKVPEALKLKKFRKTPRDYTKLSIGFLPWMTSLEPADSVSVKYSERAASETTTWTYHPEDRKYHTSNFENDFSRDNLLVLYDNTEYITKDNYAGSGAGVTYCDYKFSGGEGKLFSQGTVKDIEWKVEDGKLVLIDTELTKLAQDKAAEAESDSAEASEEETEPIVVNATLYPGKTWIGWISANNGGSVNVVSE